MVGVDFSVKLKEYPEVLEGFLLTLDSGLAHGGVQRTKGVLGIKPGSALCKARALLCAIP